MFARLNKGLRRMFAWPLIMIGAGAVQIGGWLICAGAWALDYDVAALLRQSRGE